MSRAARARGAARFTRGLRGPSADARQLLAAQHVDDARATDGGAQHDAARVRDGDRADRRGGVAQGVGAQRSQQRLRRLRGDDRQDRRPRSRRRAGRDPRARRPRAHRRPTGMRALHRAEGHGGRRRDLVECALATPPRVGSRSTCTLSARAVSRSGRRVRAARRCRCTSAASKPRLSRRDMIAMPCVGERPAQQHDLSPTRACCGAMSTPGRTTPMPAVLMYTPSALARDRRPWCRRSRC
jgi:hypothetical protein